MGAIKCLVTNIVQNVLFCKQMMRKETQKRNETHTGLEELESE